MKCAELSERHSSLWERCPHCGEPGLFPNVRAAQAEAGDLDRRYQAAKPSADPQILAQFEGAMSFSRSVLNRSIFEVMRLATSDSQLYNTYYQQLESEARIPEGNEWDAIR